MQQSSRVNGATIEHAHTAAKHIALHLYQYPVAVRWGGNKDIKSLVLAEPTVKPFTEGAKEHGLHFAADAAPSNTAKGITEHRRARRPSAGRTPPARSTPRAPRSCDAPKLIFSVRCGWWPQKWSRPSQSTLASVALVAHEQCDNFADPQTKYLVGKVWMRHLHYTHNLKGT